MISIVIIAVEPSNFLSKAARFSPVCDGDVPRIRSGIGRQISDPLLCHTVQAQHERIISSLENFSVEARNMNAPFGQIMQRVFVENRHPEPSPVV